MDDSLTADATEDETKCDSITLEIIHGALKSTMREMEVLIERTSMSPFIREKKDFHAGIYTGAGKLIATSSISGADNLVQAVLDIFPVETIRDGDIYWYNDCYMSKGVVTHTPDQVFLTPVFSGGNIVAYVEGWAHFNDIGGMRVGSLSADCTEIYQEGIIVPPVRLARMGEIQEDLLRIFYRNSRFPEMIQGDVRALLAAIRLGKRRLEEYIERFGTARVASAFDQLIAKTAQQARIAARAVFPEGIYETAEAVDSDGQGNGPFNIRYRLEVTPERIVLDATKTDDQAPGPINLLLDPTMPARTIANYILSDRDRLLPNSGLNAVLDEVKLRPGSLLQPKFPAPLGFRGATLMRQIGACMALVAVATRGNSNAAHSAYVIYYLRGQKADGSYFLLSDGVGVGYGARPTSNGNDAIYLTANENYPCEFVELVYPMRIRQYAINRDTGGPGRWRGGCGVIREIEVLAPQAMLSMRIDSINTPPWGVNGGKAGRPGGCIINPGTPKERRIDGVSDGTIVRRGDIVRVMTGGGGGWGHPFDRPPEEVLEDVLNGFVSAEAAAEDYGVILSSDEDGVDREATRNLRAERPPTKLFHQNGYKDALA